MTTGGQQMAMLSCATSIRARKPMKGKLKEPMSITDHNQQLVCILPVGFHFDDERWEAIWARYEEKGETLIHDDLRELFPDEPTLQYARQGTDLD